MNTIDDISSLSIREQRDYYANLSHRCYLYLQGKMGPQGGFMVGFDLSKYAHAETLRQIGVEPKKINMNITGHIPQIEVEFSTKSTNLKSAILRFRKKHPSAQIDEIDGKEVWGMCENCELPIFSDEDYHHDEDGVMWHKDDCTFF